MSQAFRVTDRSGLGTFYRCERAFFHERLDGPLAVGLEPVGRRLWALVGTACHRALTRAIARQHLELAVREAIAWLRGTLAIRPFLVTAHHTPLVASLPTPWPASVFTLVEAVATYWWRLNADTFFREFDVLSAEAPVRWAVEEDAQLEVQPDLVLRAKIDRLVYPFDFKFTTRITDTWVRQWQAQPQVVAYSAALDWEHELGGMIIEGVDRGDLRDGLFTSPLVAGYARAKTVTDVTQMARVRTSHSQVRVAVPAHQIQQWVHTAPGISFGQRVRVGRPSTQQVDAYADLVRRHVRHVDARQMYQSPASQWPMSGMVVGECASPQRTCPYAAICHPGRFEPVALQSRDPHHAPYVDDDAE